MKGTRIHPIWKEAAEKIASRVEAEGYGLLLTWEEIRDMLEINGFKDQMSKREFEAAAFDQLLKVQSLKDLLLDEYKIYLKNRRNKGYQVLTPKGQVTEGFNHEFGKVRKDLNKTMRVMVHVEKDLLDEETQKILDRNLNKIVFVIGAANKRRLPPQNRIGE